MTITELYNWAKENNVEDIEFEIQDGDGGGFYSGTHKPEPEIKKEYYLREVIKVIL